MPDQLHFNYFAALALAHLGFTWFCYGVYRHGRAKNPLLLLFVAGAALFVHALYRLYSVIPALWWPGASEHIGRIVQEAAAIVLVCAATERVVRLIQRWRKRADGTAKLSTLKETAAEFAAVQE